MCARVQTHGDEEEVEDLLVEDIERVDDERKGREKYALGEVVQRRGSQESRARSFGLGRAAGRGTTAGGARRRRRHVGRIDGRVFRGVARRVGHSVGNHTC